MVKSFLVACAALICGMAEHASAADALAGLPAKVASLHRSFIDAGICESDAFDASKSYDLGKGNFLHVVPCWSAAYNQGSRVYLSTSYDVQIESTLTWSEGKLLATVDFGDAAYEAPKGELTTYSKGRGIGDCGAASLNRVEVDENGVATLRTVELRAKDACDGGQEPWPVVFQQN